MCTFKNPYYVISKLFKNILNDLIGYGLYALIQGHPVIVKTLSNVYVLFFENLCILYYNTSLPVIALATHSVIICRHAGTDQIARK
jgi:hypothetical protein